MSRTRTLGKSSKHFQICSEAIFSEFKDGQISRVVAQKLFGRLCVAHAPECEHDDMWEHFERAVGGSDQTDVRTVRLSTGQQFTAPRSVISDFLKLSKPLGITEVVEFWD